MRRAKVIKPSFYKKELFERYIDEEKMYDWDTAYVSKILHAPVYAGNLIVAERPTKTMRSKKRQYIPFAEREVIYGTHEPIIEQNRWNNVQKILQSRPPVIGESSSGYDNIFRGIIKCADCGSAMLAKVEQKRKRNNVLDKTFYCCTKYRRFGKEVVYHTPLRRGRFTKLCLRTFRNTQDRNNRTQLQDNQSTYRKNSCF